MVERVDSKFPEQFVAVVNIGLNLPSCREFVSLVSMCTDCDLHVEYPGAELTQPTVRWGCGLLVSRGVLVICCTSLVSSVSHKRA